MKSGFKRVYAKNGRWWFVDKDNKWQPLTRIDEGKPALARAVHALVPSKATLSALSGAIADFRNKLSPQLAASTKNTYRLQLATVEAAFTEFPSAAEIEPVDVERFLDQWSGNPRSQQAYRDLIIRVFQRAVLRGDCKYNPAREIPAVSVPKRDRYVEDDEFIRMIDTALTPEKRRGLVHGERHALLWQLAYLTGQRSTEIRLLRKSDVSATHIRFQPTKTYRTTKASVDVPITPEIRTVLEAAAQLKLLPGVDSMYVIPMRNGQPYSGGVLTGAWNRTRARAGLKDANLMARDLRAKAISDGELKQGLSLKQLQSAATHSSEKMTRHYARRQRTPESPLRLEMPRKKAGA